MRLQVQFNLALGTVLLAALAAAGWAGHRLIQQSARDDVLGDARLVMEAAASVGSYTATHVQPHLVKQMDEVFLPQTVASFAATEAMANLRRVYPGYSYREAVLQPTHPRNLAADWEATVVHRFRGQPALQEIVSVRTDGGRASLLLAKPIQISDTACLQCHSSPAAAPPSMIRKYGQSNGFGWRHNEIVGARLVSIPLESALGKADQVFLRFMLALGGVALGLLLLFNLMLGWLVLRPLRQLTAAADQVAAGAVKTADFSAGGSTEIRALAAALDRVRGKLKDAVRMLVNT